jgi:aromatic-L-amino-acid decarboxylase
MLKKSDFQSYAQEVVQWIQTYMETIEDRSPKSKVQPGDVLGQVPASMPNSGQDFNDIFGDFKALIPDAMTHWQHPNFHAYFPANSSVESLLAEFITAAMGAQCMMWDTSPAAAELEERMMQWLGKAIGLSDKWEGVIQDTASSATLVALIQARERKTDFQTNDYGVKGDLRVYCSEQTHSSIEKAMGIAGMGRKNLVYVPVDEEQALRVDALEEAIRKDIKDGKTPCAVVVTIGTTGTLAVDPLKAITEVCKKYDLWCHVDAAYAGSALILPEYQAWNEGVEDADSFVFNPHKWLFTNFDCSAYWVKDVDNLLKCFEILPEYLKTKTRGQVNDYRDWGIPLGRRFRALKLWFVMRSYGLEGLQTKLRQHINWAREVEATLADLPNFYLVVQGRLNGVFFSYDDGDLESSNARTKAVKDRLDEEGRIYLTHTTLNGRYLLRLILGQTYLDQAGVDRAVESIRKAWIG